MRGSSPNLLYKKGSSRRVLNEKDLLHISFLKVEDKDYYIQEEDCYNADELAKDQTKARRVLNKLNEKLEAERGQGIDYSDFSFKEKDDILTMYLFSTEVAFVPAPYFSNGEARCTIFTTRALSDGFKDQLHTTYVKEENLESWVKQEVLMRIKDILHGLK